jgi:hypothetical protein
MPPSKEIQKLSDQFDAHEEQVKNLINDRSEAKKEDVEPQTKLSQKEIEKSNDIYLKPERSISASDKFNEKFREDYNFAKEYVQFIAEHREIIGETIEAWTRPFGGMPAEFWKVPTNRPVWGPRYLAERIRKCTYHRLTMKQDVMTERSGYGTMYGQMVADTIVERLSAIPVSPRKSIFMGKAA